MITVSLPRKVYRVQCWPIGNFEGGSEFYAEDVLVNPEVDRWVFVGKDDSVVAVLPKSWIFVVEPDNRDHPRECGGLRCSYNGQISDLIK